MRKLTEKQAGLLAAVRENPGLNTHQLAEKLGHRQTYRRRFATGFSRWSGWAWSGTSLAKTMVFARLVIGSRLNKHYPPFALGKAINCPGGKDVKNIK